MIFFQNFTCYWLITSSAKNKCDTNGTFTLNATPPIRLNARNKIIKYKTKGAYNIEQRTLLAADWSLGKKNVIIDITAKRFHKYK